MHKNDLLQIMCAYKEWEDLELWNWWKRIQLFRLMCLPTEIITVRDYEKLQIILFTNKNHVRFF